MARAKYYLHVLVEKPDGGARRLVVEGRNGWALANLIEAGDGGLTTLENPAPRWSAYVHKLRTVFDINIETIDEPHGGPYAGTHGRYVLRSKVHLVA